MRSLGIHSLTHNSGVALVEDGVIKYALEEERLSRIKHHPGIEVEGRPPYKSLEFILKENNLSKEDIDLFTHVGWPGDNFLRLDIIRSRYRDFAKEIDPSGTRTQFVDHHLAHAASAYYASDFNDALVLSIDGQGDWISTSLYVGEGSKLKKIDEYFVDQSLGLMFSRAAMLLGFGGFGVGEGKLTAFAAYGEPIEGFPSPVFLRDGRYGINKDYFETFQPFRTKNKREQRHKDFGATIQNELERTVEYILEHAVKKTGKRRIAIGGGVGLNCSMNGRLAQLPYIEKMFVQPAANDGGLCLGAAYLGAIELGDTPQPMTTPYLGPEVTDEDVEIFVRHNGLTATLLGDPARKAAELIEQGKVVAWMQGRLEYGPRALGHRSLFGDPRSLDVRDKMNVIKQREPWRPVAPSIIYRESNPLFDPRLGSKYMTHAIPMTDRAKRQIPAGIHVNDTGRVQVVDKSDDEYFRLIEHFEKLTGVPAVLNTSLNKRGHPLYVNPSEVVEFFYTTPTDHLIIGRYLFSK